VVTKPNQFWRKPVFYSAFSHLSSLHPSSRQSFQIHTMDTQKTAGSFEDAILGNAVIHTATSNFSLPFRVPKQPTQGEVSGLSDVYKNQSQNSEKAEGAFKTSIISEYSANRLGSTVWQCKICGKRGTDIIHAATSTLSPLGSSTFDVVVPVCSTEKCVTQGRALAESLGKNDSSRLEATTCENCGNPSKMNLCAACRFTC